MAEFERYEWELTRCTKLDCSERACSMAHVDVPGVGECLVQLCQEHTIEALTHTVVQVPGEELTSG